MAQHLDTKLIFSYLSISWRTFPFFVTLRAVNPQAKIVHVEFAQSGHPNFDLEKKDSRSNSLLRCTYALFDRIIVANQGEAHRFKAAALASDKNIENSDAVVESLIGSRPVKDRESFLTQLVFRSSIGWLIRERAVKIFQKRRAMHPCLTGSPCQQIFPNRPVCLDHRSGSLRHFQGRSSPCIYR